MKCHIKGCQHKASKRCSDCLKPMCERHSKRVNTWLTDKDEVICTACVPLYWWSEPQYKVATPPSDR